MAQPEPTQPETTQAEPTTEQSVNAIFRHVAEQMHNGVPPAQIEKDLVAQGLEPEMASTIVDNMKEAMAKAKKDAGRKNMMYGALWCIGGTIVTAVSYQMAAEGGGGKYVLAWGAILFGAIQFIRGAVQSAAD